MWAFCKWVTNNNYVNDVGGGHNELFAVVSVPKSDEEFRSHRDSSKSKADTCHTSVMYHNLCHN